MKNKLKGVLTLLFLSAFLGNAFSQDTSITKPKTDTIVPKPPADTTIVPSPKWRFVVEPYLMFGNMRGQIGLDSLPTADVDADADQILENLEFGAMLYFEMYKPKWAISLDVIYMKLGQDVNQGTIINSGKGTVEQVAVEVAGMRRLLSFLEAGVGFRVNSIKSKLDLNYNTASGVKQSSWQLTESWVDPIIVARTRFNMLNNLVFIQLRGDIGGFGIGSDIAWQAQLYAGVRISKLLQASIGYRVISTDFEDGTGKEYFLYDINTYGPVIRFGFNF
jgi:hypothetical protein